MTFRAIGGAPHVLATFLRSLAGSERPQEARGLKVEER